MSKKTTQRKMVFGVSDLITDRDAEPQKYVQVFDIHGKPLGKVEVYVIGYTDEEK